MRCSTVRTVVKYCSRVLVGTGAIKLHCPCLCSVRSELVLYRHGWVSAVQSFPEIPKFLFGLESHLLSSIASERSASDRGSEYQKFMKSITMTSYGVDASRLEIRNQV